MRPWMRLWVRRLSEDVLNSEGFGLFRLVDEGKGSSL